MWCMKANILFRITVVFLTRCFADQHIGYLEGGGMSLLLLCRRDALGKALLDLPFPKALSKMVLR